MSRPMHDPPQRKILIVDDSRATQAILRRIVQRAVDTEATHIQAVDSAAEALDRIAGFAPDLILTDWHMPRVSGLELVQTLRQLGHHRVRIGLVTAETDPERLAEAHSNGVSFVLNKPFDDARLMSAVRAALDEATSTDEIPASPVPSLPAPAGQAGHRATGVVAPAPAPARAGSNGPLSLDALRRLLAVAMQTVPHEVADIEPLHFPQLSSFVLRCTYTQPATGAEVLGLLDFPTLCLVGAGGQGPKAVQAAVVLGRPDPELVHRATTVLRVSAKLLEGHSEAAPWRLERTRIVARALADPADLLSKSRERTDAVVRARGFERGRLCFLKAPT